MRLQVDFHLKLMTLTTTAQVEHAEQEAGIVGAGSARVSRGRGRGAYTGGRKNARRGSCARDKGWGTKRCTSRNCIPELENSKG